MTSKYEGWGLVITEAMSYGIPVISYDCPFGPKEIIQDGINGFLVNSGDEEILAQKISFLMENPVIRKEMGFYAKKRSQDFKIDIIMIRWEDLFNYLIS